MSRHTTIAAVTAAFGQIVDGAATSAVPGAGVVYSRPDASLQGANVFLFMYQARPNPAARNLDLPNRDSQGVARQRPVEALDLYYLLTFVGNDTQHEPQLMMGSVVSAINAQPLLSPDQIRAAGPSAMAPPFIGSDLDVPVVPVRFSPVGLSLEEMSKVWSVFFQTPYELSIAYCAAVALVEADVPIRPPLPAQRPRTTGGPLTYPVIAQAQSSDGAFFPITVDSSLVITGKRLRGEITLVRFLRDPGNDDIEPDAASSDRITCQLPTPALATGVHRVRVVNRTWNADPTAPVEEFESNLVSFVLRPVIRSVTFIDPVLTVDVAPDVNQEQRIELLLDQLDADDPAVHVVPAEPLPSSPAGSIAFDLTSVAGQTPVPYAVRVRIDGITSPLNIDTVNDLVVHTVTV